MHPVANQPYSAFSFHISMQRKFDLHQAAAYLGGDGSPIPVRRMRQLMSKLVHLDAPIPEPEEACLGCGQPALPEQAFCSECVADGLSLICYDRAGHKYHTCRCTWR